MDKLIIPKIVIISMVVMILLAGVTGLAYWFEISHSDVTSNGPSIYELFSDAFKVGLGAFIGVLSQWASKVFGNEGATDS